MRLHSSLRTPMDDKPESEVCQEVCVLLGFHPGTRREDPTGTSKDSKSRLGGSSFSISVVSRSETPSKRFTEQTR